MIFRSLFIALGLNAAISYACVAQEATQQCVTAFSNNMASVSTGSQTAFAVETIARNECRSDGTAINVGYSASSKSLLGGLTSSASDLFGNYETTSTFCSAYKEGRLNFDTSASYDRKPLEAMATQFNSCMATAREFQFAVWSTQSGPAEVVYSGQFYPIGDTKLTFRLGVSATGAECLLTTPNGDRRFRGREVTVENQFSVVCRRQGREVKDAILYRAADINVWFNGKHYPTSMPADRVFLDPQGGPTSSEQAKAELAAMQTKLAEAQAEAAAAQAEADRLRQRKFFARIAYVGEHGPSFIGSQVVHDTVPREPNGQIIHFSCGLRDTSGRSRLDGRNAADQEILGDRMGAKVCGSAPVSWQFIGHQEGNNCGYDAYVFVCVQ